VAAPHMILQSLLEVGSDRNLHKEALYNMNHRREDLKVLESKLYAERQQDNIPLALAKSCRNITQEINQLLWGEGKMVQKQEYDDVIRKITDRGGKVKEIVARAADDTKSAEEIVKEIASGVRSRELEELSRLRPNERLMQLFHKL